MRASNLSAAVEIPTVVTSGRVKRLLLAAALAGCGDAAPPAAPTDVRLDFPAVTMQAGEELADLCQSATLGNDGPLFVNRVELAAGPGWHHSNWHYVPESAYEGPDGVWPCSARDFENAAASALGGTLFAQSTQSTAEAQAFPAGAAIVLPPRVKIVGQTHGLNVSDAPLTTAITLTLHTLPEAQVTTRLRAMSFQYHPLELPPRSRSRFTIECDLATRHENALERPLDFRLYYALAHYHELGRAMRIEAFGGPRDGEVIWEVASAVGEPAGRTIAPPYDLTGTSGVRVSCDFDNPRDEVVRWGIGDQEMCVFLAFTDSEVVWAGGALTDKGNQVVGQAPDGTVLNEAPCNAYLFVPRD